MRDEDRQRLREAGRRDAEQSLPDVSPESYRRVAEIIRKPINRFVRAHRLDRGGDGVPADDVDRVT